MLGLTPRIVATLRKYMRDPAAQVVSATTLSDLGIDRLDLPMIVLDVEDVLGVQIDYHDDGCESLATVRDLIANVISSLQARALQPRLRTPRRKSNWMSTGA
jgi:acyl carrier protein